MHSGLVLIKINMLGTPKYELRVELIHVLQVDRHTCIATIPLLKVIKLIALCPNSEMKTITKIILGT